MSYILMFYVVTLWCLVCFDRLVVLCTFLSFLSILSRTCIPWFLNLMMSLSSQVCLTVLFGILRNYTLMSDYTLFDSTCFGEKSIILCLLILQTNELYQLSTVAFCLLVAWVCSICLIQNCKEKCSPLKIQV